MKKTLWVFCVVAVGEAVTILLENLDDSSGFTVGGASAAHWGIAPLTHLRGLFSSLDVY